MEDFAKNLIPKHKADYAAVERLAVLPYEVIKEMVPALLAWLQDMNYPVARALANYLKPMHQAIAADLLAVLKTDDEVWKYWIILEFGTIITDNKVLQEIKRIATQPTTSEQAEGLPDLIKELNIQ